MRKPVRRRARVDSNQPETTRCLRQLGVSVELIHRLGGGIPDYLLGFRGLNYLVELKDENKPPSRRALTPDETEWHDSWRGQVDTCKNLDEILVLIGAKTVTA